MASYLRALLSETERKNGWTLAEVAGDAGPEGMQRLLNFYSWDTDGVRDDVRDMVVESLGDADHGVLVVEETAFPKKGRKSAGVARQYSSSAGRLENCQIGVFLAYSSPRGQALIDRELYLPVEWTADRRRCREAGIDDGIGFAGKPVLARRMIERVVSAGVPFAWVTGDHVYGQDGDLRAWLESRDIAHVLAVPTAATNFPVARIARMVADLGDGAWTRIGGAGAAGATPYDWAVTDIRSRRRPDRRHWLLARRSAREPTELRYYVCFGPAETTLPDLVRVAGNQGTVAECLSIARNRTGLDHYQVRGYQPWYRHITLSMAAAAFLALRHDTVI
ncbi:transposase [Gandjariella thermophila]|uniref:Transposase n=2 Tax=Gandjariella thermophila TaxID=1931992 RepID=A0A4D4J8A7_9PSEU|nr:transposase [Gandjariella thermophila]